MVEIPSLFNLTAALVDRRLAAGDGNHPAIECDGRVWTYGQAAEAVDRLGAGLLSLGVARDDRVLIALPDSFEFVVTFLAAIRIGAVAVPCSTFLGPAEYGYFLRESRATVLFTTTALLGLIEPAVRSNVHGLEAIVVLDALNRHADASPDSGLPRTVEWESLIEPAALPLTPQDTRKDSVAFWLWTSGSTGQPKAAAHRNQDAPWCCESLAGGVLGMSGRDRVFSAAKLFHAYGLGNSLFFPWWFGATAILHPGRATADVAFSIIDRAKPTLFFAVPTLYGAMLQIPDSERRFDLRSLRLCVSAAEPLPAALYRSWHDRFGTEILDGIGSTEMLHVYVISRPGSVRPGSTGSPIDGYEVKVVDERGAPTLPNQIGDLLVKGPSRANAYWNRPDATERAMQGEWFASGDKYSVDEDGYFWYAGRGDDMFKVVGEWVSPVEIEAILREHPDVLECAVVPWPDDNGLVKPKAYVILKDGCTGTEVLAGELQAFVRARAAHYKCPRVIEFLIELPKTATGKIQRFKLRAPTLERS